MKKSSKIRVAITALMLASAACVLLGKSILYGPGFSLSYPYIDALFPGQGTSFKPTTTVYVWLLLVSGVAASALAWVPAVWAAPTACCVCASSLVYHVVRSVQNGYSVLQIDGMWEFFMLALPLAAVILCVALFQVKRAESEE
ncbi:MAG: hypothetical protein VB099_10920 [Candidatus Limiplasma sp.]|nr:hypothetical protein [Candidatus Limiplasma sp.]